MAIDSWIASSGNWTTAGDWFSGEPTSSSDVFIASASDVTVTSNAPETVNTIVVDDTDELDINNSDHDSFTVNNGAPDGIFGVVNVDAGNFTIGNGGSAFYNNSGTLSLNATSPTASFSSVLEIDGTVTFNGAGAILLGPNGNNRIFGVNSTLIDMDNVVSGSGAIGEVNFINRTTVEAGIDEDLDIYGSAEGGEFDNENLLLVSDDGELTFGDGVSDATIVNTGTIELQNIDPGDTAKIGIRDNVTIDCSGEGQILFAGANSDNSGIVSAFGPASLTLKDGSLGVSFVGGSIGDANLTLNLEGFDIDIKGSGENGTLPALLVLAAASMTLDSTSQITAEINSEIFLEGPVTSNGVILAEDGGEIFVTSSVTGAIAIDVGGIVSLLPNARISGFVGFGGASGTLKLESPLLQISNAIVGAQAGDKIDLTYLQYNPGMTAVWLQGGIAGTLEIENTGSLPVYLALAGQYNSGDFALSSDGANGTLITVVGSVPAIRPDDFNGTSFSDVLWRNSDDTLATWLMDGSSIISSAIPTYEGNAVLPDSSWSVAGIGDFDGNASTHADVLWRQSSTGALAEWVMNGSAISASATLTYQGSAISPDSSWSVAGIGDFNDDGDADILWRQSGTGTLADWSMNGSTITSSAGLTFHGSAVTPDASWSVAGIGDFNGDGNADILWRQGGTGALADWSMSGSTIVSSAALTYQGGAVTPDSSWSVAGIGDFNGQGFAEILWRQSSSGALALWQMNGSVIQSSLAVTYQGSAVTPDSTWNIVEIGDFNGNGNSDVLWRQGTAGALVEWQMNGAQIVSSQAITSGGGPVTPPSSWQVQAKPTDFV
jgi:FG-GAP-like repeat